MKSCDAPTRADIEQMVGAILGTENPQVYAAGVVLMTATAVGTDPTAIAEFAGMTQEKVARIHGRCVASGIFRGDEVHLCWADGDAEDALLCDALVGAGLLRRANLS